MWCMRVLVGVVTIVMSGLAALGGLAIGEHGLAQAAQLAYQQAFASPESQAASPFLHASGGAVHHLAPSAIRSSAVATSFPTVPDGWSPKITLRTADGWVATPIHAALLPDGKVFFMGLEFSSEENSP